MVLLQKFKEKIATEKHKITNEIENMWSSIHHHWNRLDIDLMEREELNKKYSEISYATRDGLFQELKRYEELTKANIKVNFKFV